jgi:hypothetical protein
MATIMREIPEGCHNVPLGLVKIYWESGGHSLASISNDRDGVRHFHCCNWINIECFPLKEALKEIIRIEVIQVNTAESK